VLKWMNAIHQLRLMEGTLFCQKLRQPKAE
jgi:hypothetical protein